MDVPATENDHVFRGVVVRQGHEELDVHVAVLGVDEAEGPAQRISGVEVLELLQPEVPAGLLEAMKERQQRVQEIILKDPNVAGFMSFVGAGQGYSSLNNGRIVVALKPLHDKAKIKRVVVSTYQSVSGAGKDGMDELDRQTKALYSLQDIEMKKFPKRIAFNLIPHIDVFMDDGFTKEEWKMVVETKKILDPKIKVHATCVRVPTFIGHAEAINLELEEPLDDVEARRVLAASPGVMVIDRRENGGYITPQEVTGQDAVFVSRVRVDPTVDNGLSLWVVSDNLRKGAALNAIQIAEELVKGYI